MLKQALESLSFGAGVERAKPWPRGEHGLQLLQDQPRIKVDVAADGYDGDATVGDPQPSHIRAREGLAVASTLSWSYFSILSLWGSGTYALQVRDLAQLQVPYQPSRERRVAVVVHHDR